MERSKKILNLSRLVKQFLFFTWLVLSLVTFKGCDLFGDEEHCQYESNESRIWLPDQHFSDNAIYIHKPSGSDFALYFLCFNHLNTFEKFFVIENVCPLGALAVNIKITQKDNIGLEHFYAGTIYEVLSIKGKNHNQKLKTFFFRISGNEYISYDDKTKNNLVIELADLPETGPRKFFVMCRAHVYNISKYGGNPDNWAKDNILKVEYNATFVKYN